jgi:uncharacterized protein (DUF885 family)
MDDVDDGLYAGEDPAATSQAFRVLVGQIAEQLLELDPVEATLLGDHRRDDSFGDPGHEGVDALRDCVTSSLSALDAVDDLALGVGEQVDLEILRTYLMRLSLRVDTTRDHVWNPLLSNPGHGLYALIAREFAPAEDRSESLVGRLRSIPHHLASAREVLDVSAIPPVHLETAIDQFHGTSALVTSDVTALLERSGGPSSRWQEARDDALVALDEHTHWLRGLGAGAQGEARIGAQAYEAALWLWLDGAYSVEELHAQAVEEFHAAKREIEVVAARITGDSADSEGVVHRALRACVNEWTIDDTTLLSTCRETFDRSRQFVIDNDLVTVHDDPVDIIEMPEIHRGQAGAYCDPPGPLETVALPTFYAVSPTPSGWSQERIGSYYREHNGFHLENLSLHEGVPGHVLQLGHHRRATLPTSVRSMLWDGAFVEGWAVYGERMALDNGYRPGRGTERERDLLHLAHLKMRLRVIANTLLDIGVHHGSMSQEQAMELMVAQAFQEEAEAHAKWRRALLSYCQLTTYFAGSRAVTALVGDLRRARPAWSTRAVHDAVLAHGSPGVRHLRTLLDLA